MDIITQPLQIRAETDIYPYYPDILSGSHQDSF